MNWWEKVGTFLMEHQVICGLLVVVFLVLYCFVIYVEDKWGD